MVHMLCHEGFESGGLRVRVWEYDWNQSRMDYKRRRGTY